METISQNKCSSLGMLFGAIALILGIFHFSVGPFSAPPPTLEGVIAEKVSSVKKGIIAGLKGEKPQIIAEKKAVDIDKILDNAGILLAVIALVCAFIGGMRKENGWSISGALIFGGGTLAFHALLFGIGLVCGIILLILIFSFLGGGSPI
ncbi:MAG: hypothetical protein P0Y63_23915 [Klebsiella huaxiensis]|uniref:hypothetical protein n=1 Tax=Klebsiella TaxID=570 RepID=UPI0015F549D6|nr:MULTISPECIES: hypothetical protein [Klebsiella]MBA7930973.1 hypothetical protein [Klebsiella sp. RHBSTW-00215]WEJ88298.1 MAG: hypothetical protein P0Y63_23915 [Klebsiella huaxiensis]